MPFCPCYQDYRDILLNQHDISAATPILDMFNLFMSSNVTALAEYICKACTMYHVRCEQYLTVLPISHIFFQVT